VDVIPKYDSIRVLLHRHSRLATWHRSIMFLVTQSSNSISARVRTNIELHEFDLSF